MYIRGRMFVACAIVHDPTFQPASIVIFEPLALMATAEIIVFEARS